MTISVAGAQSTFSSQFQPDSSTSTLTICWHREQIHYVIWLCRSVFLQNSCHQYEKQSQMRRGRKEISFEHPVNHDGYISAIFMGWNNSSVKTDSKPVASKAPKSSLRFDCSMSFLNCSVISRNSPRRNLNVVIHTRMNPIPKNTLS